MESMLTCGIRMNHNIKRRYMKISPAYMRRDNTVSIYAQSGPRYTRGDAPRKAGLDPDFTANLEAGLYKAAKMIELSTVGSVQNQSPQKYTLTNDVRLILVLQPVAVQCAFERKGCLNRHACIIIIITFLYHILNICQPAAAPPCSNLHDYTNTNTGLCNLKGADIDYVPVGIHDLGSSLQLDVEVSGTFSLTVHANCKTPRDRGHNFKLFHSQTSAALLTCIIRRA